MMVMTSSDRMGDRTSTGGGDVSDFSPSLPRTSVSSGPFTAAYPYDVDDSVACSPTPTDRNLNNWSRPARTVYGGVRQFLSRALKEVHFSSTFFPSLRSSSAQPSQSFQSISILSQQRNFDRIEHGSMSIRSIILKTKMKSKDVAIFKSIAMRFRIICVKK